MDRCRSHQPPGGHRALEAHPAHPSQSEPVPPAPQTERCRPRPGKPRGPSLALQMQGAFPLGCTGSRSCRSRFVFHIETQNVSWRGLSLVIGSQPAKVHLHPRIQRGQGLSIPRPVEPPHASRALAAPAGVRPGHARSPITRRMPWPGEPWHPLGRDLFTDIRPHVQIRHLARSLAGFPGSVAFRGRLLRF